MRNRGIEIFLLPEQPQAPAAKARAAAGAQQAQELEAALGLQGVPGWGLPHAMAAVQAEVAAHAAQRHR